jgi:predicted secreted protein
MATAAKGTALKISNSPVGELTSISGPGPSADTIDVTALDSADGYKEYLGGFKDGGEVSVSGFLSFSDTGQSAIITAFEAGTSTACTITFPTAAACAWSFNAIVTGFETGAELDGAISFDATFKITGKPTLSAGTGS